MTKKASVEAVLSLNISDWKKGLAQAKSDASAWQQSVAAQAAPPLNRVGNPNADWQRAMMHAQTGLPLPGFLQGQNAAAAPSAPPIPRATLDSFGQWNHLIGTASSASARMAEQQQRVNQLTNQHRTGLLELGHALQDATYGLRGVINNVPGIVQGFGGSAKLAGAGILAAVGIDMLMAQKDAFEKQHGDVMKNLSYDFFGGDAPTRELTSEEKAQIKAEHAAGDAIKRQQLAEQSSQYAKFLEERMQRDEESRKKALESFEATERLKAAEGKLAMAKLQSMEGSARIEAELTETRKQEMDAAARRFALMEKFAQLDREQASTAANGIADMEQQKRILESNRKKVQVGIGSDKLPVYDNLADPTTELEIERLKNDIAAAKQRVEWNKKRAETTEKEKASLRQFMDKESTINQMADAVTIATEKARETKDKAKKVKKETGEAFDILGDIAGLAADVVENAARAMDQARALKETREDATVDHLRSRGRGAAADRRQRALTEERRARQLQEDNPGMSADEAKRQARQERIDSRRGISGAQARPFQGIDAFRAGRMARPEFPALLNVRRAPSPSRRVPAAEKGGAAADPAAAAVDRSTERIVSKLDELKPLMQQPVADRLKPAA